MIDYCYTCGKELDWQVHDIKWERVYKGATESTEAFCSKSCSEKVRQRNKKPIQEQLALF